MMNNPREILDCWVQAVNTRDIVSLLGLYDTSTILIPTFSNRLLNTPEKLRDYFETLSSRPKLGIALHERSVITQTLSDQLFTLGGIYNWRFAVNGELLNFEARFSYLIDLKKSTPILHHHSSQIPRTL